MINFCSASISCWYQHEHQYEPDLGFHQILPIKPLLKVSETQLKLSPKLLLPTRAIRLCMVDCRHWLGGSGCTGWVGWVVLVGGLVSIVKIWFAVTPLSRRSRVCESTFYWTSLWCSWPRGRASSQWDLSFEARLTNSARHVIRTGYKYKYEYIEHKYTLRGTIPQFRPQCDLLGGGKSIGSGQPTMNWWRLWSPTPMVGTSSYYLSGPRCVLLLWYPTQVYFSTHAITAPT